MTIIRIVRQNPEIGISLKYTYTEVHSCDGRIQKESLGYMDYQNNHWLQIKYWTQGNLGYNSSHSGNLPSKYSSPIQNNYA